MNAWESTILAVCFCFISVFHAGWLIAQSPDSTTPADGSANGKPTFAIAIHGGAGRYPAVQTDQSVRARRESLRSALQAGTGILKSGGTSLQAVEEVIRLLEDDPQFNAGVGSVYNSTGGHELDASIMDGRNLACGAVAGTTRVKNPITLARLVMQKTPHVLLGWNGCGRFCFENAGRPG